MKAHAWVAAALLAASGCGDDGDGDSGIDPGPTERWVEHACEMSIPSPLTADDLRCGTLGVPVRWEASSGPNLAVEVAVLGARSEATEPPLVFFGGGPGIPNLDVYLQAQAPRVLRPLNEDRDIVFFDPRGSGRSVPLLSCQEIVDAIVETFQSPTRTQDGFRDAYLQAYADCRARLDAEGGVDFDGFHSAAMAQDVVAMMDALGYAGAFDVYGLSYGARLAQVMMRDVPDRVRAAVLDAPVLVETSFADAWPANFERSLDVLFAACAASESCAETHPDLEAELYGVVAQLNETPFEAPVSGLDDPLYITGDRLLVGLQGSLYNAANVGTVLQILEQAPTGESPLLTLLAALLLPDVSDRADGQYATVLCAEEIPFDTPESIAAAHAGVREELVTAVGTINGEIFAELCDLWPVAPRPSLERQPVVSDVPTLVLTGGLDPAVPPSAADTLLDGLANGQSLHFPPFGHGVLRAEAPAPGEEPPCAQRVVTAFLADPGAPVDGGCVETLPPLL